MEKVLKKIAVFTGLNESILKNAIEADNPDKIYLDGLKVLKNDEIETIKTNAKRDGILEGEKKILSSILEATGMEGDFKSVKSVLSQYKKNVLTDAKIEPDKKIQDLTAQLQTAQKTISEKDNEIASAKTNALNLSRDFVIASKIPANLPSGISKKDAVMLLSSNIETEHENGKFYPVENGKKMQDDKGNFIELETYIDSQIEKRGWNVSASGNTGGKGGTHMQDSNNGSISLVSQIKSSNDFAAYCEAEGINQNSAKGQKIFSEAMKNEGFSD